MEGDKAEMGTESYSLRLSVMKNDMADAEL